MSAEKPLREDYVIRVPDVERGASLHDVADLLPDLLGASKPNSDPVEVAIAREKSWRWTYGSFFGGIGAVTTGLGTLFYFHDDSVGGLLLSGGVGVALLGCTGSIALGGSRIVRRLRHLRKTTSRIMVRPNSTDPLDAAVSNFVSGLSGVVNAKGYFSDFETRYLYDSLVSAGRVIELRSILDAVSEAHDDGTLADRRAELDAGVEAAISRLTAATADLRTYRNVLVNSTRADEERPSFTDFAEYSVQSARSQRALSRALDLGGRITADAEYEGLARPKEITS